MNTVVDRTLTGEARWQRLEDAAFERCAFDNCVVRRPSSPAVRAMVRNLRLLDVSHRSCWLNGLLIEDTVLDGLRAISDMPLFLFGCAFTRVTLSGSISHIKINRKFGVGITPAQELQWEEANLAYYSGVDWALDIRKGRFTSVIDLEAIPGSLIKRDPETQVLVTREQLQRGDWQSIDYGSTVYDMLISSFLRTSAFPDVVLIAARGNRKFKQQMAVLENLRARGLAQ